jgi:hypothetical protein
MIIDIPQAQDHLYVGSGLYLAALDGDCIVDMQPLSDDAAIKAFAQRHAGARIVAAVGSGHQLIVTPEDCGDLRWSAEQSNTIWHARDVLAGGRKEQRT